MRAIERLLPSVVERCASNTVVKFRKARGLNQQQFGERLQEGQAFVSKIENGHRQILLKDLPDLCAALEVRMVDFIAGFDEELRAAAPSAGQSRRAGAPHAGADRAVFIVDILNWIVRFRKSSACR